MQRKREGRERGGGGGQEEKEEKILYVAKETQNIYYLTSSDKDSYSQSRVVGPPKSVHSMGVTPCPKSREPPLITAESLPALTPASLPGRNGGSPTPE